MYVMSLSLKQEQNMKAILSSVICVLSMLMVEITQLEEQYYKLRTNILYLINLFNFHGRNIYNPILDINHKGNITYTIIQYSQILYNWKCSCSIWKIVGMSCLYVWLGVLCKSILHHYGLIFYIRPPKKRLWTYVMS